MKSWIILILLTLFTLTACAAPSSASPTPTIVRLDRSALTAIEEAAEVAPTATVLPLPSSTPTKAPAAATAILTATATVGPAALEAPTPTATTAAAVVQAEILSAGINLREGPGMSYATVGTAAKGDKLEVTGASADGNWLQITTKEGKSGWISGRPAYTRITGSLKDVPLVETSSAGQPPALRPEGVSDGSAVAAGGKLVFATSSGGDLYTVNLDGSGLQKLTGGVIDPVVSPDGRQVAYTRWDGANRGALYVLDLSTGSEQVIAGDVSPAQIANLVRGWAGNCHLVPAWRHGQSRTRMS